MEMFNENFELNEDQKVEAIDEKLMSIVDGCEFTPDNMYEDTENGRVEGLISLSSTEDAVGWANISIDRCTEIDNPDEVGLYRFVVTRILDHSDPETRTGMDGEYEIETWKFQKYVDQDGVYDDFTLFLKGTMDLDFEGKIVRKPGLEEGLKQTRIAAHEMYKEYTHRRYFDGADVSNEQIAVAESMMKIASCSHQMSVDVDFESLYDITHVEMIDGVYEVLENFEAHDGNVVPRHIKEIFDEVSMVVG